LPGSMPSTSIPPRRTRTAFPAGPRRAPWRLLVLTAAILLGAAALVYPSFQYVERPAAGRPQLVYRGDVHRFPVVVENGEAYVPLSFIRDKLDPDVHWDESGVMVVTTSDKVVKLRTESLTAYVNQHPVTLEFPVILDGKEPYVPATALETLYPVASLYSQEHGIFLVRRLDIPSTVGQTGAGTVLRSKASALARRVAVLPEGEQLVVYGDTGRWLKVETTSGLCGFVPKKHASGLREEAPVAQRPSEYVPTPLKGDKVVLAWEHVEKVTPDPSAIGEMPGLNVVSPTWFHLADTPGELENRADMRYVNWAHSRGYQVWALFSNSFDPERTSVVLRSSELRDKAISQLLIYADIYSLDGINVDFENVYLDDGPYLTQFMRELTPLLHNQGLTVSIDITVKSSSPNWSLFLERDKLAQVVDYVMLMAYDQYPHGSKVAGPVSTIPWTEWTIQKTLEEVPRDKLVLGVPFYTRLWKETVEDGKTTVTPRALGMAAVSRWLREEKVTPEYQADTGLLYAEKQSGNDTYKVWIEDASSMKKRVQLVKQHDLAGVAAWRRGFETPDIWEVICETIGFSP
jgi:spore germination protein YaaH